MAGTEFVRGTYHPQSGALILEDYRKDDPNGILGLDKYRLIASDPPKTIAGVTGHGNRWSAQFFLTRE